MNPKNQRQEGILNYWFGVLSEDETPYNDYYTTWFAKRDDTDRYIKTNFERDSRRQTKKFGGHTPRRSGSDNNSGSVLS